jgi:GT2 family glycosyltransferase
LFPEVENTAISTSEQMTDERTIFDEPHHQSLEVLAARALAERRFAAAFRLADRRCRILPAPEPHSYVLRGEASYYLGAKTAAIADVAKALDIAPDDVGANRRMLAWTRGAQQLRAAFAIIQQDLNLGSVRAAAHILREHGQRTFARVNIFENTIEGWAVWDRDAPLEVSITADGAEISEKFDADVFHPLGEFGFATSFRVHRPKSTTPQALMLSIAGKVFHSARAAGSEIPLRTRVIWPRLQNSLTQQVTVIVPVYRDYDATRVCVESLLYELKTSGHRTILVDDATPDPRIARCLAKLTINPRVEVIINARNLGFIGSVNRALDRIKQGDVILLNSDTIVPRGFIDRLTAAARSSPDIGTVTPFSNNGEFVSFPLPNSANPLRSRWEVERLDDVAAKANSDTVVDIPSGIGFCLYVTRACLERVGSLSEEFARGYLEDVDFCLRARDHGFRNVCAPSVYVGHAGSKSFGREKRSLVVRNLRVLERRFPGHRSECAAFSEADPLRPARQALERLAASVARHSQLFVTGGGAIGAITRHRASSVSLSTAPALILEVRHRADGALVNIRHALGEMPQSLQFDLSVPCEYESMVDFIKSNKLSRIEFLDPTNTPFTLVDLLISLKVPYDLFIADAGLLGRRAEQYLPAAIRAAEQKHYKPFNAPPGVAREMTKWPDRWRRIARGAQQIIVPDVQAEAFATSVLPRSIINNIHRTYKKSRPEMRKRRDAPAHHLGIVPVRSCAHEQWLMSQIARQLGTLRPEFSVSVIGATLDDISLMHISNAFVTGAVEPAEFEHLVGALGVDRLFVCAALPIFGHPIVSVALSINLPIAYFDWAPGLSISKDKDLTIAPRSSLADIISALDRWLAEPKARSKYH